MNFQTKMLVLGVCLFSFLIGGACIPPGGAETPARATARATILTIAEAVKVADKVCATYALQTKEQAVAVKCADAYDLARPSLIGAEAGVDGWNDTSKGRLACLATDAITALEQIALVLEKEKIALPAIVLDGLELAASFKKVCTS